MNGRRRNLSKDLDFNGRLEIFIYHRGIYDRWLLMLRLLTGCISIFIMLCWQIVHAKVNFFIRLIGMKSTIKKHVFFLFWELFFSTSELPWWKSLFDSSSDTVIFIGQLWKRKLEIVSSKRYYMYRNITILNFGNHVDRMSLQRWTFSLY